MVGLHLDLDLVLARVWLFVAGKFGLLVLEHLHPQQVADGVVFQVDGEGAGVGEGFTHLVFYSGEGWCQGSVGVVSRE